MLIDTHCHIHESDYPLSVADVLQRAHDAGVWRMICVGTSEQSSADAVRFASEHDHIFASVGVHPHDTKDGYAQITELAKQGAIAVGEIGLDYYYNHSPRDVQIAALESQIQTALDNNLPIIFHVREAFDDFWPLFDNFQGIRGVLHSFTDTQDNLDQAFARGLYVGINGISTFTKDPAQQKMYASVPLERMLLETDAPFLTPTPYRGTINEPAFVSEVAKFHAKIRGIQLDEVAAATTTNATTLFRL
ncbi:MAG: TatD DNase family protein [Patescibacteria group bacterium]|nr:TatD DNase family protein [Patescibacteria group bacterium]